VSTRVNKRFLSRTVASSIHSRSSRDHTAVVSTSRASAVDINKTKPHNTHTVAREQHQLQTDLPGHRQHSTTSAGKSSKRKHTSDKRHDSDRDQQTNVYDVYEYMNLNERYSHDKKSKSGDQ